MSLKSEHERMAHLNYSKHNSSVLKCLKSFYKDEQFLDLVFICKDNLKVKAHKFVVSSCSEFLKNIILESVQDTVYISLPDVEYGKLKFLIDFMYSGWSRLEKGIMIEEVDEIITLLKIRHIIARPLNDKVQSSQFYHEDKSSKKTNVDTLDYQFELVDFNPIPDWGSFKNPSILKTVNKSTLNNVKTQVNKSIKQKKVKDILNPFQLVDGILNVPDFDFYHKADTEISGDTDVENVQFTKLQEEALTKVYMCHKSPSRSIQESLAIKFGLPLKANMLWFGKKRIDDAVGLKESFAGLSNIDDLTLSNPVNNHHTEEQSIVKPVRKKPKKANAINKAIVIGDTLKSESLSSVDSKESTMKLPESDPDLMKFLSFKRKHSDTVTVNKKSKSSTDDDDIKTIPERHVSRDYHKKSKITTMSSDEIRNEPHYSPSILCKKKRKILDVNQYNDVSACVNNVNIQHSVFENKEKTNAVIQEESSHSSKTIMNTTQNSVTIYRCTICEEMLVSENELQIHFKKVHSSKVYQCMVCNECFLTEDNLVKHSGKHLVNTSGHNELKLNE